MGNDEKMAIAEGLAAADMPGAEDIVEAEWKSLEFFREQIKDRAPDAKETKKEKEMREFVELADLRHEMDRLASQPFEVEDLEEKIKLGKEALNYSVRYSVDETEIGLLYDQFLLFDIDGDGVITLEDFAKVVSYISPELKENEKKLKDNCQIWFGQETFYPNSQNEIPIIEVTFQMYVEAVLAFRYETERRKMVDVSNFPFWSLRDCIVYSRFVSLDGYVWKRGSGNVPRWQKRHFRIVNDEKVDDDRKSLFSRKPSNTGSKVCLVYDLDEEKSQGEVIRSRKIDLRDLYLVQFSPKTNLPTGEEVEGLNLVCFKLSFGDQTRMTLACEEEQAMRWASIFHRFSVAGKLITDWRLQYAGLSKEKITTRDWMNAGYTIYRMKSYIRLQQSYKQAMIKTRDTDITDKDGNVVLWRKLARMIRMASIVRAVKRGAPKLYCTHKERLILRVCHISEDNLESAMNMTQYMVDFWSVAKYAVKGFDDYYCRSIGRSFVFMMKNFVSAFLYYKEAKQAYSRKRYAVSQWQSNMLTRECAVCKTVFNSCSTKAEKKKHHCRSCGRTVCHTCSTNKIFFEITQKFKRVCDECLATGKPHGAINVFEAADHTQEVSYVDVDKKIVLPDIDAEEDSEIDEAEFKRAEESSLQAEQKSLETVRDLAEDNDKPLTKDDKKAIQIAKSAAKASS